MKAFTKKDEYWMRRALALSRRALGQTQPNPLVGAVVLDSDGRCLATGAHEKVGSHHAEARALQEAGSRAKGGTLYVTLEPCTHQGRTPPCTDQVIRSGIQRVVIASPDPNPNVQGGGMAQLRQAGVEVIEGCLEKLSTQLNRPYFHFVTQGRPLVTAKVALSLDGKIGAEGVRVPLSGPACVPTTMKLRAEAGAILVGVNTVLADDPQLNVRGTYPGREPIRGVIDPDLRTPPHAKFFSEAGGPVTLFCRKEALDQPAAKVLEERGAHLHPLALDQAGSFNFNQLFQHFGEVGVTSILVEGGAKLLTTMVQAQLIDRWVVYLTPQIMGPLWNGRKTLSLIESEPFRLDFRSAIRRGDDWQLTAWPR